jgi:hypothetical protein
VAVEHDHGRRREYRIGEGRIWREPGRGEAALGRIISCVAGDPAERVGMKHSVLSGCFIRFHRLSNGAGWVSSG